MNKFKLLFIIILNVIFLTNVQAKDGVHIESVELDSKSDTTEILQDATYEDLTVNFEVDFKQLDDYVKYKIVINNTTNDDYKINKDSSKSEYISYEYNYDNNDGIAKKNSKTTIYITIKYNKEVPTNLYNNGTYIETNKLSLNLGDSQTNPKTYASIPIIIYILIMLLCISLIIFKKKTSKKYLVIILIILFITPIITDAIETIKIEINTKINIKQTYKISYIINKIIKEEEKDNYELVEALYDDTNNNMVSCYEKKYNIGEDTYIECTVKIDDNKRYKANERVNIKLISGKVLVKGRCETNNNVEYTCTEDALIDSNKQMIIYSGTYNEELQDNDLEIMAINDIFDNYWENEYIKSFAFYIPNEFTMPNHNITFLINDFHDSVTR